MHPCRRCGGGSHWSNVWSLLTIIFLAARVNLADCCSFSRTFADSTDGLDASGVETFSVAPDGTTSCTVTCDSGGFTSLYLRYGGAANIINNDGSDFSLGGCGLSIDIDSSVEENELGWSLQVSTDFTSLVLSCACSDPGSGNSGGDDFDGCFSDTTTVQVQGRGTVAMRDLKLGDLILTAKDRYQPIYSFGHYQNTYLQKFLQIYTASSNTPLELTRDHMIFVAGKSGPARADSLQVGDQLIQAATLTNQTITRISTIEKPGAYAPLTADGTIVVNGFQASAYVSLQGVAPRVIANRAYFGIANEQSIYDWWLSPYRMFCLGMSPRFCSPHNNLINVVNEKGVLRWLVIGRKWVLFAEQQSTFVQVVLMGVPLFLIFSLLNLVDYVVGPRLAPSLIGLAGVVLASWWFRRRQLRTQVCGLKQKRS